MGKITPIVMCGGSGTRLWPASRTARPKQFLRLLGQHSFFQSAVLRLQDGHLFDKPICTTNEQYRFIVADQLREIGVEAEIVLEPCRRDSAPALCAGCHIAVKRGSDQFILGVPADHVVGDQDAFLKAVRTAHSAASEGYIVTFGAKPSHPETAYGYVMPAKSTVARTGVPKVRRFVEKPDSAQAEKYIREGYLWNGGMFLAQAKTLLSEIDRHVPQLNRHMEHAVRAATRDLDFLRLDPEAFAKAQSISIDYAVIEKTDRAAVVPTEYEWSDVGSWKALWELSDKDKDGNVVHGDGFVFDGSNNYVRSNEFLTTLIGVDDMVVVATGDAVMVAPRDKLDQVKSVVDELRTQHRPELDTHREQFRPWGHFILIDRGERYQVKRITVEPQQILSLQKHFHRSEHWVVVRGTALVSVDGKQQVLTENHSVYIPLGSQHRLENPGRVPLELIEVQSGSYLGEDDIVRYEDAYNRLTVDPMTELLSPQPAKDVSEKHWPQHRAKKPLAE